MVGTHYIIIAINNLSALKKNKNKCFFFLSFDLILTIFQVNSFIK